MRKFILVVLVSLIIGYLSTSTLVGASYWEDELQQSIDWMYEQGLTMYDNIEEFLPDKTMTREEASKFFSVFAEKEFNKVESSNRSCDFNDIKNSDPTLRKSITSACKLGIFQWYNNNFSKSIVDD